MHRKLQATVLFVASLTFGLPAFALPQGGVDRGGGDPAPRPPLLKPAAPAAAPAVLADTSALLPGGKYQLSMTIGQKFMRGPVHISRQGGAVTATFDMGETLSGTLDTSGRLQLVGASGSDQLSLAGTVQSRRASGGMQLRQGASQQSGSFTLEPATGAKAKLQQWETDKPSPRKPPQAAENCNLWCKFRKWLGL